MKTIMLKPHTTKPEWVLVDATDQVVGRLAVKIARILMGKTRPDYTPHVASGDFVVVVNCEKVAFTGGKWDKKIYNKYTGHPGGRKVLTAAAMREKSPETILRLAVRRMLPKNKLANVMLSRLKIFAGPEHSHQAQQPKKIELIG